MPVARYPRTRKVAIWIAAILVAIGVLLGLVAPPLPECMLKVDAKDSGGFTYSADLKRTGDSGSAK